MVRQAADVTGSMCLQNHMRRKKVHDLPLANPDVYEAAVQVRKAVLYFTCVKCCCPASGLLALPDPQHTVPATSDDWQSNVSIVIASQVFALSRGRSARFLEPIAKS